MVPISQLPVAAEKDCRLHLWGLILKDFLAASCLLLVNLPLPAAPAQRHLHFSTLFIGHCVPDMGAKPLCPKVYTS